MAQLEEGVYTRLAGHAGLTALVSDRIYYQVLPQGVTLPAVAVTRVSSQRHSAMGADTGVATARIQVSCWADTDLGAKNVKEQVRAALQRYRATSAGVEILDSFVEDDYDLPFDEKTRSFGAGIDFRMHYRET